MVNELNLEPQTSVKVKNLDVEVLKGELSQKPWLIESDGDNYILLEENQYDKMVNLLNEVLSQNIEFKLEQRIMIENPVDLEDVKIVVKKEIDDNNVTLEEAVNKVKDNYPNLFYKIDFGNIFERLI